jgi:hypothetical protein
MFIETPCLWLFTIKNITLPKLQGFVGNSLVALHAFLELEFKFLSGHVPVMVKNPCKGGAKEEVES